ncbi:hypothetical protein NIASO_16170 [Niabella soli DSM 19437]|uniref:Uncharacterized protein n=1 Tax=Niabella soli DSM 19437 TaxID=929713 RepID=W0F4A0_9BACT|nr:hypothetical protein NIASO_16170 [Niabella soli DSM 19437]
MVKVKIADAADGDRQGIFRCKRTGTILIVASNRESIVPTEKAGLLAYSGVYHPSHPF